MLVTVSRALAAESDNPETFEYSALMPTKEAQSQVREFQKAVATRSCFEVAALTRFPLRMNYDGKTKWISNRTAFCRYFPVLFDETRSEIVAKTLFKDMPAGYRGLMFGRGDFWLQPVCPDDPVENRCPQTDLRLRLTVANL